MDRGDLREQVLHSSPHAPPHLRELSPAIQALVDTPFTLSLLCRVARPGEQVGASRHSELYARAFKLMLDRATSERRLTKDQVDLLGRTVPRILGELALRWLRAPSGYITDEVILACLEYNDIRGMDAIRYQQALEHGNLHPDRWTTAARRAEVERRGRDRGRVRSASRR